VILALKLEHEIPEFRRWPAGDAVHARAHGFASESVLWVIVRPGRLITSTVPDGVLIT
jgi:hypothetical protein